MDSLAEYKESAYMTELDFTIEFDGENLSERLEGELFLEADRRLRQLAADHNDLRGAAVNVRRPAKTETSFIYEVTVVVYARPSHIAASEKDADPLLALKGALSAVERQVREKRDKLAKRWERPGNDPVTQEVIDILTAEETESG
jgi:ribosome-associated translation inhibitor RaiA